jgi:hypothetical protein
MFKCYFRVLFGALRVIRVQTYGEDTWAYVMSAAVDDGANDNVKRVEKTLAMAAACRTVRYVSTVH